MIPTADLKEIARARLRDAQALYRGKRYDGAIYVCGYAIEVGLKARICQTLKWTGYPETNKEFTGYQSFKTHDLDVLLKLSGIEGAIKAGYTVAWSDVVDRWKPELRYQRIGTTTQAEALIVITATRVLLKRIL